MKGYEKLIGKRLPPPDPPTPAWVKYDRRSAKKAKKYGATSITPGSRDEAPIFNIPRKRKISYPIGQPKNI